MIDTTEENSKFKLMDAKGVRNFLPEDKIPRQKIMDMLRETFERFGFSPLETPAIERLDVLTAKFGAGEDSDVAKEIFKLTDQGGRKLGLRFDLTVPMSKVVGMNPNLNMPFKRYQMQPVWRDGPIKLGRYREFWQCDVDIVGVKSMLADAEILSILDTVFTKFGFDFVIKLSNRKLLNSIMEYAGFGEYSMKAIIAIDKLEKIGEDGVRNELLEMGFEKDEINRAIDAIGIKGSNSEILEKVSEFATTDEGKEGIKELRDIMEYCEFLGVNNVQIDVSLARGLEYYTGPIFEVYLKNSKITSSVAGGGRYDKLIGMYLGGKKEYPATGVSFGLEPIYEALKLAGKIEAKKTTAKVFVIPIGKTLPDALKLASKLRSDDINTEVDLMKRSISKNLDYANALGIPYVIFVGEREIAEGRFTVRDMKTGKEEKIELGDVSNMLRK
ncbi:MAG: histidine--tRNA ligase [Candidatus Micrarchaeota archaeon]|nr:histidine--tRNA ligase [Candidatus Micrarchaeota archaeon]